MQPLVAIVMAAGKGTRMVSDRPKVLHEIAGSSLLAHVLQRLEDLRPERVFVLVGHEAEQVKASLPEGVTAVLQSPQLGTGHAVDQVSPHLKDFKGRVLILSGDVPLLTAGTLSQMNALHDTGATMTMLTTCLPDPTGYGRIKRDDHGNVAAIIEHKDATEAQRAIPEINVGTYLCDWQPLQAALARLTPNNAQGEYYLTDAIADLVGQGLKVAAHVTPDNLEGAGINTRAELAALHVEYNQRTALAWSGKGVTVLDPATTVIGPSVRIGRDTVVEPGVRLLGRTVIGEHCLIGMGSQLRNMQIGSRVEILHSYMVDAAVGDGTHIGPYAQLRPGTQLGENVRIGNFVEVKNSTLGDGTKANHLAYIGDATVGKRVNLGCGVITVNYDGKKKFRTVVEDDAFVGSNSNLIAPITIGAGGYIGAGSTLTQDVPAGALAVGRGRQFNKEGWVAAKAARNSTPTPSTSASS